jgi:hypothetical protein
MKLRQLSQFGKSWDMFRQRTAYGVGNWPAPPTWANPAVVIQDSNTVIRQPHI